MVRHMTTSVGGLRRALAGLPDEAPVILDDPDTGWRLGVEYSVNKDGEVILSANYNRVPGEVANMLRPVPIEGVAT